MGKSNESSVINISNFRLAVSDVLLREVMIVSLFLLVALVIGRGSTYQPACSVIRQMERNIARLTNNVVTLEEKLDKASRIVAYTTRLIAGKTKAIANQERKMESQKRTITKFQRRRRRRTPGDATSEVCPRRPGFDF